MIYIEGEELMERGYEGREEGMKEEYGYEGVTEKE